MARSSSFRILQRIRANLIAYNACLSACEAVSEWMPALALLQVGIFEALGRGQSNRNPQEEKSFGTIVVNDYIYIFTYLHYIILFNKVSIMNEIRKVIFHCGII